MKVGDIYVVHIPDAAGREQMGKRPAIIVQEKEYNLPTVFIVPLTSKIKALDFSGTMLIKPDDKNHLDKESVAMAFQLRAIDRKRLHKKGWRTQSRSGCQITEVNKGTIGNRGRLSHA